MVAIERADGGHESRGSVLVLRGQVGMALRASLISCAGEAHHAFVLDVASRTGRRKGLFGMVERAVVTSQARFIVDGLLKTGGGDVAGGAFVPDQVVRVRYRSGIVGRGISPQSMPAQPAEAQDDK